MIQPLLPPEPRFSLWGTVLAAGIVAGTAWIALAVLGVLP